MGFGRLRLRFQGFRVSAMSGFMALRVSGFAVLGSGSCEIRGVRVLGGWGFRDLRSYMISVQDFINS